MAVTLAPKFNVATATDRFNNDRNQAAQKLEKFEIPTPASNRKGVANSPLLERRRSGSVSSISIPAIPTIIRTDAPLSPLVRTRTSSMNVPKIATTSSDAREHASPRNSPVSVQKAFNFPKPSTSSSLSLTVTGAPPQAKACPHLAIATPKKPVEKKANKRVNLGPGCGMLDWIRLGKKVPDLAGTGGKMLEVTQDELAKHNTAEDAWTCIKGKVYNMTPYIKFHPGGKEELMRAAGMDSTILFDEVHSWVNIESMMKKCLVGTIVNTIKKTVIPQPRPRASSLVIPRTGKMTNVPLLQVNTGRLDKRPIKTETESTDGTGPISTVIPRQGMAKRDSESSDDADMHTPQSPIRPPFHIPEPESSTIMVVPPSPVRKSSDASYPFVPRWDWHQGESYLSINMYTHTKNVQLSDILVDIEHQNMTALMFIDNYAFQLHIALMHPTTRTQVTIHATKVEIRLYKEKQTVHWPSVGKMLEGNGEMIARANLEPKFRSCRITSIEQVTHDTKLFTVALPLSSHMAIPIGHHVRLRAGDTSSTNMIERSYTPVQPLSASKKDQNKNIQFMIKLYKDGAMSQHLAQLRQGDYLSVGNPEGTFETSRLDNVKHCVLLAAGTGFTPMARVIQQLLSMPDTADGEKRKIHLIFANKTEQDIAWREELEQLSGENKNFLVTHILSAAEPKWDGLRGRINMRLLRKHLPAIPTTDHSQVLITVCGPLPFTAGITTNLVDLSYPEDCIHIFT